MIKNVIFDLGGVLIDWNPRYLYRKIFKDPAIMEHFLTHICTQAWNERHDEGVTFAANAQQLIVKHPQFATHIKAYDERWGEMINGPIQGTVDLLEKIYDQGRFRLLGLSNWSAEKFPVAEQRFPFLQNFEDIVVSGRIKIKKPNPEIFRHLCIKHGLVPEQSLFIDDVLANIEVARHLGFHVELFRDPDRLAARLIALDMLT